MNAITLRLNIVEADNEWILLCESPFGRATCRVPPPFDDSELLAALHTIESANLRSAAKLISRKSASPELTAREFGRRLVDVLFTGEARVLFDRCRTHARESNSPVRLLLETTGSRAAQIPWEFATDPLTMDDFLALRVPFARTLRVAEPVPPITVRPPLKVLGVQSRPQDLPALDYQQEQRRIAEAFDLASSDLVEVTWLADDRWHDVDHALKTGTWHVLHFVGHGGFNDEVGAGYLELTGEDGNAHRVSSVDIGRAISRSRQLRLVVLNACESATSNSNDVFASTAAKLMREGVPAVVAMQYEITDLAALTFSAAFYEAIARNAPVDEAVTMAREIVRINLGSLEWATPVLFLASDETSIFDVRKEAPTIADPRPAQSSTERSMTAPPVPPVPAARPAGAAPTPGSGDVPASPTEWTTMREWSSGLRESLDSAYRRWAKRPVPTPDRPEQPRPTERAAQQQGSLEGGTSPSGVPGATRISFAVGPDDHVALGTSGGEVRVWSLRTHQWVAVCSSPPGRSARLLAWHPAGRHLAGATDDEAVVVWDLGKETRVRQLTPGGGPVRGLAFSANGRWLAISCSDRTLHVVDSKGRTVRRLRLAAPATGPPGSAPGSPPLGPVEFSNGDRNLVVATNDGRVSLLDVQGRLVTSWPHDAEVTALAGSESLLATCTSGGRLRVWDLAGELVWRAEIETAEHLAWAGDGRLVAASRDGTVKVWDAEGGHLASTRLDAAPVGVGFSAVGVVLGQAAAPMQVWKP